MIPVQWSQQHLAALEQSVHAPPPYLHPIEPVLAPALLLAAKGDLDQARAAVLEVMSNLTSNQLSDIHLVKHLSFALFVVQHLDHVESLIHSFISDGSQLSFAIEQDGPFPQCVRWEIAGRRRARIVYGSNVLQQDYTKQQVLLLWAILPLIERYLASDMLEAGEVILNLWDHGVTPGLAFCDFRPEYFLVPDNAFIVLQGYQQSKAAYRATNIAWPERRPVALWRGSTTGRQNDQNRGWRSLPRVHLCELGLKHQDLLDAGITGVVQVPDPESTHEELKGSGLLREFVPPDQFDRWRYQIDIDGNTNAYGLIQKLSTGSAVLKIASPLNFRQWYYDRLVPWHNFVPVEQDMNDLVDKIRWLREHDDLAQSIGVEGRNLAESLDCASTLENAVPTIAAAIRAESYRRSKRLSMT